MSIETVQQIELLWQELSRPDDAFEPPAWHEQELRETERRLEDGREQLLDWESAKEELRRKT